MVPGSGRIPGEGNGNPFQYSCLEKSHGRKTIRKIAIVGHNLTTKPPPSVVFSSVAQLCPTLCNPMDCSLTGSPSTGFSRQEYQSGLPCSPPGDLPHLGISVSYVSCTGKQILLNYSITWEALTKDLMTPKRKICYMKPSSIQIILYDYFPYRHQDLIHTHINILHH